MTCKSILVLFLVVLALPAAALAVSINYTYDAAGRLTKEVYSDGNVVEYTYDAAGNITCHSHFLSSTTTSMPSSTTTAPPATTTTIGGSTTTTTIDGTTTTTIAAPCPATQVLWPDNQKLQNLRDFRDSKLAKNAIGRKAIEVYYNNAGSINAALERSPALKAVARKVFEAITPMVGKNKN